MSDGTQPDDEPKSERFNMFISKSEMKAIEEWAWEHRIRSKSEAVRRLVQMAIRAEAGLSSVLKANKSAYEATRSVAERWNALVSEEEYNFTRRLAFEAGRIMSQDFSEISGLITSAYIRSLDVHVEAIQFAVPAEFDDAIKRAEEMKENSQKFWDAQSSVKIDGINQKEGFADEGSKE